MEQFPSAINNLEYRAMKRIRRAVTIDTPNRHRDEKFYVVGSIMFIKEIKGMELVYNASKVSVTRDYMGLFFTAQMK